MKLDINEVYHNYIVRVVIFSLFTYKRQIRQPNVFRQSVLAFTKKRIPWKIDLEIDIPLKLDKEEEREVLLRELLDGIETSDLTTVIANFTTPMKETTLRVDLRDEENYGEFLYL